MRDWQAVLEASSTVPRARANQWLRAFFLSRYHNPKEARWKCERILAALRYLKRHADSFEKAGYAIASGKGGHVSKYIMSSLYRFFGYVDDAQVNAPPLPKTFIEAAHENERHEIVI